MYLRPDIDPARFDALRPVPVFQRASRIPSRVAEAARGLAPLPALDDTDDPPTREDRNVRFVAQYFGRPIRFSHESYAPGDRCRPDRVCVRICGIFHGARYSGTRRRRHGSGRGSYTYAVANTYPDVADTALEAECRPRPRRPYLPVSAPACSGASGRGSAEPQVILAKGLQRHRPRHVAPADRDRCENRWQPETALQKFRLVAAKLGASTLSDDALDGFAGIAQVDFSGFPTSRRLH